MLDVRTYSLQRISVRECSGVHRGLSVGYLIIRAHIRGYDIGAMTWGFVTLGLPVCILYIHAHMAVFAILGGWQ